MELVWADIELLMHIAICQMLAWILQVASAEQSCGDFVSQCVLKGVDGLLFEDVCLFFYKDNRKAKRGTEDMGEKVLMGNGTCGS